MRKEQRERQPYSHSKLQVVVIVSPNLYINLRLVNPAFIIIINLDFVVNIQGVILSLMFLFIFNLISTYFLLYPCVRYVII